MKKVESICWKTKGEDQTHSQRWRSKCTVVDPKWWLFAPWSSSYDKRKCQWEKKRSVSRTMKVNRRQWWGKQFRLSAVWVKVLTKVFALCFFWMAVLVWSSPDDGIKATVLVWLSDFLLKKIILLSNVWGFWPWQGEGLQGSCNKCTFYWPMRDNQHIHLEEKNHSFHRPHEPNKNQWFGLIALLKMQIEGCECEGKNQLYLWRGAEKREGVSLSEELIVTNDFLHDRGQYRGLKKVLVLKELNC